MLVWQTLEELPPYFSANSCEFYPQMFRPCFSRVLAPPKKFTPKFTPKIVGTPLQFQSFEPKMLSRRFSASGQSISQFEESFSWHFPDMFRSKVENPEDPLNSLSLLKFSEFENKSRHL